MDIFWEDSVGRQEFWFVYASVQVCQNFLQVSLALSHRRRAKLFHIWSATQAVVSRLIPQQRTQQASLHRLLLDYVRERAPDRRQSYRAQIIPAGELQLTIFWGLVIRISGVTESLLLTDSTPTANGIFSVSNQTEWIDAIVLMIWGNDV